MPRLAVSDGEIYFEETGSGHPLVLAHGIGGNHAIWFQQLAELGKHYRVISFDHRGFGNSIDSGDHGRSAFVADLERLLDHLGLQRAALVGQSMGGGTCLGFAAGHPERVSALVMCDSLHGFVESSTVREIMHAARGATDNLTQLERVLGKSTREGRPAHAALYTQLNSFNRVNRSNLAGSFSPLVSPEVLAATGIPVLFLVGENDVLFPVSAVQRLHQEVAGSEFVAVAGAGHSVFFEDPNAFNSAVLSFLSRRVTDDPSHTTSAD
jgi:pimeloyl-ACP methyl ester carboxylesterase